jgi:hypothetical protein
MSGCHAIGGYRKLTFDGIEAGATVSVAAAAAP